MDTNVHRRDRLTTSSTLATAILKVARIKLRKVSNEPGIFIAHTQGMMAQPLNAPK